jgi:hypothetical protein
VWEESWRSHRQRRLPGTWAKGLLGIYLNERLAGRPVAWSLRGGSRRVAAARRGEEAGQALRSLAADAAADRAALLDIMATLGVPVRAYKVRAAWIGERPGGSSSTAAC